MTPPCRQRLVRFCLPPLGVAAALLFFCGCQTVSVETSDGRPMPEKPREPTPAPAGALATQMTLLVSPKAADSNGNGFPDAIGARVYLFSATAGAPVREDGEFIFDLYEFEGMGVKDPMRTWRFSGDTLDQAFAMTGLGPSFVFTLSLLDNGGTDRFRSGRVDLVCRFLPAGRDAAILSEGVRTIEIGRGSS